jgi:hypothetical protein
MTWNRKRRAEMRARGRGEDRSGRVKIEEEGSERKESEREGSEREGSEREGSEREGRD